MHKNENSKPIAYMDILFSKIKLIKTSKNDSEKGTLIYGVRVIKGDLYEEIVHTDK